MNKPCGIVIIGATSGIGQWLARHYASLGHTVGIAGRRQERLDAMCAESPHFVASAIDICAADAPDRIRALMNSVADLRLVINAAGCGWLNPLLDYDRELRTVMTDTVGFTAVVDSAFNWFAEQQIPGHIAAITSVAGTRGLGPAPSYSASKRYDSEYLLALAQLSHTRRLGISVTDIRPGFIATDFLDHGHRYPGLMTLDYAATRIARAIALPTLPAQPDRSTPPDRHTTGQNPTPEHRRTHYKVAYIDWRWHLLVILWRLLPTAIYRRLPLIPRTR